MGDSDEGPSNAAQSALSIEEDQVTRGFFGRIIDVFSTPSTEIEPDEAPREQSGEGRAPAQLGMLNLQRVPLEDVAIPKVEIVSVPVDIKKDDLVKVFRESGLTRLPVYEGTLDSPIGLIHLKDFALNHGFNGNGGRFSLRKLVRPLLFAPPSMPIGVLLQKMQSERMHMALVIDEYGGVDGLVTIEDLIEQVIGEIADEHDIDEGVYWSEESPGQYIAQARTPLDEFEEAIGYEFALGDEDEEIDTLGGLVFLLIGRVPARGEVVPHPSGAEFVIVDADPRRIKRIRVRLPQSGEEPASRDEDAA
ncbi:MAG: hemolysin family protein [Paracoccaceae bacterium]